MIFIVGGAAVLQVIGYLSIFLQGNQVLQREALYASFIQNSSASTLFVHFVVAAPFLEEIIFRGFILGYWFKDSPRIGLIVSVMLFTLAHFPNNMVVFAQYFLTSAVYGLVYQKSRRLEITTGMHILNNLPAGLQVFLNLF